MKFSFLSFVLSTSSLTIAQTITQDCSGGGCASMSVDCAEDEDCIVSCPTTGDCDGTTVMCPLSENRCEIQCDDAEACSNLDVECRGSVQCEVLCTAADACTPAVSFTTTFMPMNNDVGAQIYCKVPGSCEDATLTGPIENFFAVACQETNSCRNMTMVCGTAQSCSIHCDFVPDSCVDSTQDCSEVKNLCHKTCDFGECDDIDQVCTPGSSSESNLPVCLCNDDPITLPPTAAPTSSPTSAPTASPTSSPTSAPTSSPTASPTSAPTDMPTPGSTASPVASPGGKGGKGGKGKNEGMEGAESSGGGSRGEGGDSSTTDELPELDDPSPSINSIQQPNNVQDGSGSSASPIIGVAVGVGVALVAIMGVWYLRKRFNARQLQTKNQLDADGVTENTPEAGGPLSTVSEEGHPVHT